MPVVPYVATYTPRNIRENSAEGQGEITSTLPAGVIGSEFIPLSFTYHWDKARFSLTRVRGRLSLQPVTHTKRGYGGIEMDIEIRTGSNIYFLELADWYYGLQKIYPSTEDTPVYRALVVGYGGTPMELLVSRKVRVNANQSFWYEASMESGGVRGRIWDEWNNLVVDAVMPIPGAVCFNSLEFYVEYWRSFIENIPGAPIADQWIWTPGSFHLSGNHFIDELYDPSIGWIPALDFFLPTTRVEHWSSQPYAPNVLHIFHEPYPSVSGGVGVPTIYTYAYYDLGEIIDDVVTMYPDVWGICWNTCGDPTIADNKAEFAGVIGAEEFFALVTNLVAGETYYVRAYARNAAGYGYGDEVSFTFYPSTVIEPPTASIDSAGEVPAANLGVTMLPYTVPIAYVMSPIPTFTRDNTFEAPTLNIDGLALIPVIIQVLPPTAGIDSEGKVPSIFHGQLFSSPLVSTDSEGLAPEIFDKVWVIIDVPTAIV